MKLFAAVAPSSTMRRLVFLSVGIVLGVAACGEGGGLVDPPDTRVAQVTVVGPASLQVGGTAQLNATAKNAAGETLQGKNFTWKSSNEAVATVNAGGVVTALAKGSATITATAEGQAGTVPPGTMSITVTVQPAIALSQGMVSLGAQVGGTETDSVRVTNGGDGTLGSITTSITYGAGQQTGWLTATLRSPNAPAFLVLQASAANLQPGTYNAIVTLRSSESGVADRTVNVTFTVAAQPVPIIELTPSSVVFNAVIGQANPAAKTVAVTNAGPGTLNGLAVLGILYPAGQPAGWVAATLSDTTAPATLTLTPNAANLPPGTYTATVILRSSVAGVANRNVGVTLIVTAQAPTVTTLSAVSIDTTSATVRGRVNPNGGIAQAVFQVSTDSTLATGVRTSDPQSVANDTTLSLVLTGLAPATKYFYRVVATNAGGTTQGSILSFTTSARPVAPSATTGAATNITPTSATANGTVDPNGVNTTVFFIYGTASTSLTNRKAPADSIRTGTSPQPVAATLDGLAANTEYFYRLVARSTAGADTGAVVSFRTSQAAVAPSVTTGPATSVTTTTATVNGTVDPNGTATQAFFEVGTSSDLSGATSSPAQTLSGTTSQALSLALTGLAPSTRYYYRVVATNAAGTARGSIQSFTTQAAAVAPAITSIALNPDTVNSSSNNVSNRTVTATVGTTGTPTDATVRLEGPGGTPVVTCTDTTLAAGVFECGLEIPRNSVGTYTVRSVVLTYGTGQARTYTTEQLLPLGETTVIAVRN